MKRDNNQSEIPEIFEFSYGSVLYLNRFAIKIEEGKILPESDFMLFPNFDNDYIIPSEEAWIKFWKKMDNIGIWDWMEHYQPQNVIILDGYRWDLKIVLGNKKLECSGLNAYPGDEIGEIIDSNKSKSFNRFINAVKTLTGIQIRNMRIK